MPEPDDRCVQIQNAHTSLPRYERWQGWRNCSPEETNLVVVDTPDGEEDLDLYFGHRRVFPDGVPSPLSPVWNDVLIALDTLLDNNGRQPTVLHAPDLQALHALVQPWSVLSTVPPTRAACRFMLALDTARLTLGLARHEYAGSASQIIVNNAVVGYRTLSECMAVAQTGLRRFTAGTEPEDESFCFYRLSQMPGISLWLSRLIAECPACQHYVGYVHRPDEEPLMPLLITPTTDTLDMSQTVLPWEER